MNRIIKKFALIIFCSLLTICFLMVPDDLCVQAEESASTWDTLSTAEKRSSYGFFMYQAENGESDLEKECAASAADALKNGVLKDYTHIGETGDATSLDNMLLSAMALVKFNNYRSSLDNEPRRQDLSANHPGRLSESETPDSLVPLQASYVTFAQAQANANYSQTILNHSNQSIDATYLTGYAEIIAWHSRSGLYPDSDDNGNTYVLDPGTASPTMGMLQWYSEKNAYDYDLGATSEVGHYTIMTNKIIYNGKVYYNQYNVAGYAVNTDEQTGYDNIGIRCVNEVADFSENSFGRVGYTTSAEDYLNKVYTYCMKVHPVAQFVVRLYNKCLSRNPDSVGLNDWFNKLSSGTMNAAQVAQGFFDSNEFKNKKLSDSDFIDVCYNVMMNRSADQIGKKDWMNRLANGVSRDYILSGFVGSQEFNRICSDYGIQRGSITLTEPRDQNYGVTSFVARCYTKTLNRNFDTIGLNSWTNKILTSSQKKSAAISVASNGFYYSQEYLNKHTSNKDYLTSLYETFLGRKPDSIGYNSWMKQLKNGVSRDKILKGFAYSKEFGDIMKSYGIN